MGMDMPVDAELAATLAVPAAEPRMFMAGPEGAVDAVETTFAEVDVVLADVVVEESSVPAGGAGVIMAGALTAAAALTGVAVEVGALVAGAGAGADAGAAGVASGIWEI